MSLFAVLICMLHMIKDSGSLALKTTYDPRIPSTVGSSNGIPSAMGSPGFVLLIDFAHGSLLVCFIDWPHTWRPLNHFVDWPYIWQLLHRLGSSTGPGEKVDV